MKLNKVILGGRLGNDPESSKGTVKISLATDDSYKGKDGNKVENTNWHRVVFFGKIGEVIEKYFKKGDQIIVQGSVSYREYEEKWYTTIIASDFSFVNSAKEEKTGLEAPEPIGEKDGLPF